MEPTLRKALDAVNAGRRWTLFGMAALFLAVLIVLAFLNMMIMPPSGIDVDVPGGAGATPPTVATSGGLPMKALWVSAAAQLFFVACGTAAIMLHVSRMTRTILRAIDATRK
jgi:hypothetical protein